jgi:hypothetical protein
MNSLTSVQEANHKGEAGRLHTDQNYSSPQEIWNTESQHVWSLAGERASPGLPGRSECAPEGAHWRQAARGRGKSPLEDGLGGAGEMHWVRG